MPRAQATSLKNIDVHPKSFKAVYWMHFILGRGELLLDGRNSASFYDVIMAFKWAFRLLFRPKSVNKVEIGAIQMDVKNIFANYHEKIYRGTVERLPLRLSTIATLLEIVLFPWACGPAWVFWKFMFETKIGSLGKLIRSASKSHASLVGKFARNANADLVTSFGETYLRTE